MIGNHATELIQIEACFLTVAWIAVALRVYVRASIVRAFGWDDGWMLFAQLMHTMNSICAIGGALTGTGQLMKDISPISMMWALRFWWACYFSYCLTMIGAKVSVGLSLLRYTPITKQTYRWITHIVIYTSVVMGIVYGFLAIFQCNPVRYFWRRALGDTGTCISMVIIIAFTYVMSAIFAACDLSFAILPVFLIKGLNMNRNSKIALIPILSMACIASAAVIVRLAYVPTFRDPEFLYATVPIAIWSEVEMSLAITAGSLPTLRPLYRIIVAKLSWKISFFSTDRKSYNNSYNFIDVTGDGSKLNKTAGITNRKRPEALFCSESERNIVGAKTVEVVPEDCRLKVPSKFMNIIRVTNVQVEFEDEGKL